MQRFLLFLLVLLTQNALAANLVTDPFLTGAAGGWTYYLNGTNTANNKALQGTAPAAVTAAGGTTEFYSGCVGANCLTFPVNAATSAGAAQTLTTVIGVTYAFSFWMYGSTVGGTTTEIDIYWAGAKVSTNSPIATGAAGWYQRTINLGAATSTSTNLTILIRDDPDYSGFTFVQVNPVGPQLTVTKTGPSTSTAGLTVTYSVSVANGSGTSSSTATRVTLTDVISAPASLGTVSCAAAGGAACPSPLTFPLSITNMPKGSTLTFTVQATLPATANSTVTNVASVTTTFALDPYVSSTLAATATTAVKRAANLAISKNNGVSTLQAGGTTSYTITASNGGPSNGDNALVLDSPSAGLSCNGLTCSASGGAVCPSVLSAVTFTSSGLQIPTFPPGSSVTFTLACGVTATGQ